MEEAEATTQRRSTEQQNSLAELRSLADGLRDLVKDVDLVFKLAARVGGRAAEDHANARTATTGTTSATSRATG